MGSYYVKSARTLVFPYGVDVVGPPILPDGNPPVLYTRALTLQEEALSGLNAVEGGRDNKVVFVIYMADCDDSGLDGKVDSIFLRDNMTDDQRQLREQPLVNFEFDGVANNSSRHLHLVERGKLADY